MAVNDVRGTGDIWIYDVGRPLQTRFTFDPADEVTPVWTPGDSHVIFNSLLSRPADIFRKQSTGGGTEVLKVTSQWRKLTSDCSPDGKTVLYHQLSPRTRWDVMAYSLADGKTTPFAATGFNEFGAQFSPDGQWVAYVSDESGKSEIYVARFPPAAGKWQVSTGGGIMPRWSHRGTEIFYFTPQGDMLMAATIRLGNPVESEIPRQLFMASVRYFTGLSRSQYDVAADDQHFLINMRAAEDAQTPITLYQNWVEKIGR